MAELLARAPTRIDFAGGTLDIWPISLMVEGARTLNAAIDLYATARIRSRPDSVIRIRSQDQQTQVEYVNLEAVRTDGPLGFLARLVLALPPPSGIELMTDCAVPAGSGLGGSSALGVATASVLARFRGEDFEQGDLLHLVQSVETRVLRVPTGVQDYYPAFTGGVLSIGYSVRGTKVQNLPSNLEELSRRTILCFSGKPRFSGLSNWDVLRRYLDGDGKVADALDRISRAAARMETALRTDCLKKAAEALGEEWEARKRLSPKVSTARLEALMDTARRAGARAGKVCGAGGGGCLIFLVDADRRAEVEHALSEEGARVLPFQFQERGLEIVASSEDQ